MTKTGAWHSILSDVYHDDTECNTGNNIERENRRTGTGNKRHRSECAEIQGRRR